MLLVLLVACSSDACRQLCATTAVKIDGCLVAWGASWEDFDATQRTEFGDRCRSEWDDLRLTLELRQLDQANAECTTAADDVDSMTCDEMRALYLDP